MFDGRTSLTDEDYQDDSTSIGMTFIGFESEACNIVGYEWAVGSKPYWTDILPYTDYGLVMKNGTYGQGQIHVQLYESQTYYITVRARTGFNCHEDYIVSSSNGITLDTKPASFEITMHNKTISHDDMSLPLYQKSGDSIDLSWRFSDPSGINNSLVTVVTLPDREVIYSSTSDDNRIAPGSVHIEDGTSFYLDLSVMDKAGIMASISSPPITIDRSPPQAVNFKCSEYISVRKSLVTCNWDTIKEEQSLVSEVRIGLSSEPMKFDILNLTNVDSNRYSWSIDMYKKLVDTNFTMILTTFQILNILNEEYKVDYEINVDRSPPEIGHTFITTSTYPGEGRVPQVCQVPWSYIELQHDSHSDPETGIDR